MQVGLDGVVGLRWQWVGRGGVTSSIAGRSVGVRLQHSAKSCERGAGHALLPSGGRKPSWTTRLWKAVLPRPAYGTSCEIICHRMIAKE